MLKRNIYFSVYMIICIGVMIFAISRYNKEKISNEGNMIFSDSGIHSVTQTIFLYKSPWENHRTLENISLYFNSDLPKNSLGDITIALNNKNINLKKYPLKPRTKISLDWKFISNDLLTIRITAPPETLAFLQLTENTALGYLYTGKTTIPKKNAVISIETSQPWQKLQIYNLLFTILIFLCIFYWALIKTQEEFFFLSFITLYTAAYISVLPEGHTPMPSHEAVNLFLKGAIDYSWIRSLTETDAGSFPFFQRLVTTIAVRIFGIKAYIPVIYSGFVHTVYAGSLSYFSLKVNRRLISNDYIRTFLGLYISLIPIYSVIRFVTVIYFATLPLILFLFLPLKTIKKNTFFAASVLGIIIILSKFQFALLLPLFILFLGYAHYNKNKKLLFLSGSFLSACMIQILYYCFYPTTTYKIAPHINFHILFSYLQNYVLTFIYYSYKIFFITPWHSSLIIRGIIYSLPIILPVIIFVFFRNKKIFLFLFTVFTGALLTMIMPVLRGLPYNQIWWWAFMPISLLSLFYWTFLYYFSLSLKLPQKTAIIRLAVLSLGFICLGQSVLTASKYQDKTDHYAWTDNISLFQNQKYAVVGSHPFHSTLYHKTVLLLYNTNTNMITFKPPMKNLYSVVLQEKHRNDFLIMEVYNPQDKLIASIETISSPYKDRAYYLIPPLEDDYEISSIRFRNQKNEKLSYPVEIMVIKVL